MKAVILAGGKGTRLQGDYANLPKPMVPVCGKPVLLHQIETLRREGICEFLFAVGHLKEQIVSFFGDGSAFGVHISYYCEDEPLGTAGALFRLDLSEDFLLCNGDLIFDFSLERMCAFHKKTGALGTVFAHPNGHPRDSTLLDVDQNACIRGFLLPESRPEYYENICSAGVYLLSPALLNRKKAPDRADLDRDVLAPAAKTGTLFAYRSSEYVRDMGTPQRLAAVEEDVRRGIVCRKHLKRPQRAVFFDRDGTINRYRGYITAPKELELLPGAAAGVKRINALGYLAILATNQPVIARGECSPEQLRQIHNKMETLLGDGGAYLDAIYYCPHHPDRGFAGENEAYKILCSCRKPAPGMLLQAAKEFHIDLSSSYMVGDSMRDVETAVNAGCIPVLLNGGGEAAAKDAELPERTLVFESLEEFSLHLTDA